MQFRILFVDDEPNILRGLQRMLRGKRSEWSMAFAASGAEALSLMVGNPFDVIVTDMRMPLMDGAQLLGEVASRFPNTIRYALSGQTDHEAMFRLLGPCHQFLSKPCDADTLVATLGRSLRLREHFDDPALRKIVTGINKLPAIPANYNKLVDLLNQPDCSPDVVAKLISQDVALTAKTLQIANSGYFGSGHEVASLTTAVNRLGSKNLSAIFLSHGLESEFVPMPGDISILEGLSRHALQVAQHATILAECEGFGEKQTTLVFVAALLHDIGELVLLGNMPDKYRDTKRRAELNGHNLAAAEQEVFGASHAQVGAYLASIWGLPDDIVETIIFHEAPNKSSNGKHDILTVVHVADAIQKASVAGGEAGDPADFLDMGYLENIGAMGKLPAWKKRLIAPTRVYEPCIEY